VFARKTAYSRRMSTTASPRSLRVRSPAVAGIFYPGGASTLAASVDGLLAKQGAKTARRPRALVCPHAGYKYSGAVAAQAFSQIRDEDYEQVVLMGPSHRVAFRGVALPDVDAFETPLGSVPLAGKIGDLARSKLFVKANAPHEEEHSIEVELPFLQRTLRKFTLSPLVFGEVDEHAVALELSSLVTPRTLFVVSSDLSHYHDYETAAALDRETIDAVLRLDVQAVTHTEACGRSPLATLLQLAAWQNWEPQLLGYQNSGDTAGDKSRVVGYTAIAFYDRVTSAE
jgi:AmmeMemoRadiSam system protein B